MYWYSYHYCTGEVLSFKLQVKNKSGDQNGVQIRSGKIN